MEVKKKISILIVEDEPFVSLSEKKLLEKLGYRITEIAISATDTYTSILSDRPDIILMDVLITGNIDGIEAAEHIHSAYNIPVVFLTATEDSENIERIMRTGFYGFVGKPFREYELRIVIESALSRFSLERQLRLSEQKYRFIFENIHDVYFEVSSSGIIEEISPSVINLTGIGREWFINRPFAKLIQNSDAIHTEWKDESLPANGIYHDIAVTGPGGEVKICDIRIIRGLNASGKAVKLIGSIIDISSRKNIEERILSAKKEVESLLLSITSFLIGASNKDIVTHWNKAAETTFGIKGPEIIGQPITIARIKWEWDRVFEAISLSIVEDRSVTVKELKYTQEGNDIPDKYLNIKVTPVKTIDGVLAGFMIVGDDITENRSMRMRMNQSLKMEAIGQLAAGVAHEINTPMQYISDNTLFIRDSFDKIAILMKLFDEHKVGDARKCITIVEKKAQEVDLGYALGEMPRAIEQTLNGISRITRIVHSMKHFSHPGTQQKELTDLNRIIDDVITISRNEWKYVADVETDLMPDLPRIYCFPNEISQVLLNIIVNAAQAIEEKNGTNAEKGIIKIVTGSVKEMIFISISDTGPGIPDAVLPKIFDPFFTTKEVGIGTGQGLAISHTIIEDMHGGSIKVNTLKGKGTTFIIMLPSDGKKERQEDEI
jgi:PAS domain S-box-containing protein